MEILLILAFIALLDVAALLWGYDSRDGFRASYHVLAAQSAPRVGSARRRAARSLRTVAVRLDPSLALQA